jgi:hypothetical protein
VKNFFVVFCLVILSGCTSFRERETVGAIPAQPLVAMRVVVLDTQITNIGLVTASYGPIGDFGPARRKAQSEVPLLQQLLRQGVESDFKAALSKYVDIEPNIRSNNRAPSLSFNPIGAMVECGNLNVVCQASLRVMVTLTGEGRRTLWSATYKVGAPMNGTNDAEVMRVFFADVISRLESHRIIRKRAAS